MKMQRESESERGRERESVQGVCGDKEEYKNVERWKKKLK
jgi:hypothetical protein